VGKGRGGSQGSGESQKKRLTTLRGQKGIQARSDQASSSAPGTRGFYLISKGTRGGEGGGGAQRKRKKERSIRKGVFLVKRSVRRPGGVLKRKEGKKGKNGISF